MRFLSIIALVITAILGISFAVLNARLVVFDYYINSKEFPLSVLLVAALIIGVILGILMCLPTIFRLKYQLYKRHG